jgi:hypothetical protein
VGTTASDNQVIANATSYALSGGVGASGTATGNTTSIGSITGVATGRSTGATGNAVANSTAANAATGATDTVLGSATAPTTLTTVSSQSQANIGGSWFGNPGASSNGYAAYGYAMGAPSASVQSSYLASATVNPVVYDSLQSSGSSIFGAGVLGANYSSTSTGSYTYTASTTHAYTLSGENSFTLGLLTMGAYDGGFTSLTFTVKEGTTSLLTKTFTSLSAAQSYFTDDPVSLGDITGTTDLILSYKLTAAVPEGAGISYLLADAPVTADVAAAPSERGALRPHEGVMLAADRRGQSGRALWRFDSAALDVGKHKVRPLLRIPEPIRATQLIKGNVR